MADTIQLRGGSAALWASTNPVLADKELGVETDTQKMKMGNGVAAWNSRPYLQTIIADRPLGFNYIFDTATTGSPAAGAIQLNNVVDAVASMLYLNETDAAGITWDPLIDLMQVGTWIMLYSRTDSTKYKVYKISGIFASAAGIDPIPITYQFGSSVEFTNGELIGLALECQTLPATTSTAQAFGDAAAAGVSLAYAREDHKHAIPAAPTNGGYAFKYSFATATTATPAINTMQVNNATPSSVTNLYLHDTCQDGTNIATLLTGQLMLDRVMLSNADKTKWQIYTLNAKVSTASSVETHPVTFITSYGAQFSAGETVFVALRRTADIVGLGAGTTAVPPLSFTAGTNLTTVVAGAVEYDGVSLYGTLDTSSGRGTIPVEQHFKLIAAGTSVTTTIANYFGTTSNIVLVSGAYYDIEIWLWFAKVTAGTVTWTLTNSAAPTSQNIFFEMSPITGIVAPPGTATMLTGHYMGDATAARAFTTGSLSAANHLAHFKIQLRNGTGTSLKIQATCSAGSITPGIGSRWYARRISPNNIGTFAA